MCYPVACTKCGLVSWGGCGLHLAGIMKKYSFEQRCHCAHTKWPGEEARAAPAAAARAAPAPAPAHAASGDKAMEVEPSVPREPAAYDYDLVVIGGGSGGLSCGKEAAALGARVAVLDYVTPSPKGTKWGLGGTCVNVGCIPKKLMHTSALIGETMKNHALAFGWEVSAENMPKHNWEQMVSNISDHIGALNFGYKTQLREKGVTYVNAYGTFVDAHTISCKKSDGSVSTITARNFVVATGGRPNYPKDLPGVEHVITSDDLFSLPTSPGKTLVVGASYVALECAGFLNGVGCNTTVMVRSILLRGFDQQMANLIGDYMEHEGVRFVRGAVPTKIEKLESGKLRVSYHGEFSEGQEEFDTVLYAVGRQYADCGYSKLGMKLNPENGKIITTADDQSSIPHIFAIGDVNDGKPELTPVAIRAGKLLAKRLFSRSQALMVYRNIPTTVFTPLEYGSVGLSEETALSRYGDNVEVFHTTFAPLEWTLPHRNGCYAKLIVNKGDHNRVIGFHILSPNAGEVTQGFAVAINMGATKEDFDNTVGIHPTIGEEFTTLMVSKKQQAVVKKSGC
eukprot:TRINITY_DN174_c0_g1_i1.p1 TRINITY_DN174_c0_g1~~TRINITY_DN174_c0_g1_i1.p1  ORF type:complete len:566 (+),score=149.29 TRINITY_DN174_c0_g1_i1:49-1746(+)